MLNRPVSSHKGLLGYEFDDGAEFSNSETIDLDSLFAAIRRQFRVVIIGTVIGAIFGIGYIATSQPLYTATSQVLIDDRRVRAVEDVSALTDGGFDTAKIDSQVELLRSEKIALAAINSLDLTNNPQFMEAKSSMVGDAIGLVRSMLNFRAWFGEPEAPASDANLTRSRLATEALLNSLYVSRVGLTYVLNISFTSHDPNLAAGISNSISESYLVDQLEAKYDATRRASTWLQSRIQELKEKSLATDLAVQKFRAENNLIAADGKLVGEQQLEELNSQLIMARSATAQAEARYTRIRDIIDTGQMDAAVTEALNNRVIGELRSNFLESSKRYNEISEKLGPDHIQAQKFKNEMEGYQRVIFGELGRIAESYRSDFEIAKSREQALRDNFETLIGETASANKVLVTLRELERESETYRDLYQSFLERYQKSVQQQSFPITEARIITRANPPQNASHPKKAIILALAVIMGGMAGTAFGALREFRDRGLRTGDQVRDRLGLEFLGLLPAVQSRPLKPFARQDSADAAVRVVEPTNTIMRQVLDNPLSGFSETLRAAKIAADLMLPDKQSKIIGTVSAFQREGKSTVSKNFASLLANLGARTLLIDCDLRNPGLTRSIAANAEAGLIEALLEDRPFQSLLLVEPESKLFVLPAVVKQRVSHTSELLSSPAMKRLLTSAVDTFDYVIVDLPPLAPIVDARAVAGQIDAFLFVVEWGETPRHTIRTVLENDARIRDKCLGVVLNKVDTNRQKMYENNRSEGYQFSSYSGYYS